MRPPLNALIVGAGAAGQAYGFHLAQGGAKVTYMVREKYQADMADGLAVRCLNSRHKGRHHFTDYEAISGLEAVSAQSWDQVWLCVSSPALRAGWLPDLAGVIGDATVVMLQPGIDDYSYVTDLIAAERVVHGMITLTSFHAPLDGAADEPSMDWWFPPMSPAPFAGEEARTLAAVSALKAGGMPAKRVKDIDTQLRLGSGILMPIIASLEASQWRFSLLRKGDAIALASRAALQATRLALPGKLSWLKRLLTHRLVLRLILFIAPKATPFDLEAMLRVHFTKVGGQTREMLQRYIALGAERDEPTDAISTLLARITQIG